MPRTSSDSNPAPKFKFPLAAILAAFAVYSAVFIYESSFLVDGTRFFVLQDDGMISMRFARNLAHGHGLVWNSSGPRVEGFTNLLWVVIMAGMHLLPVAASKMSLLVQVFSGVLLVATSVCVFALTNRLASPPNMEGGSKASAARAGLVATALTLFYYPLVNWSLQGSEVSGMALVAAFGALLAVRTLDTGLRPILLYGVLALGLLLRADGFVVYGAVLAYMIGVDAPNRKWHLAIGLTLLAGVTAALTVWRLFYFGWPLPNTYYLKMTGYPAVPRILCGLLKLGTFILRSWLVPVVASLAAIPLLRDRRIGLLGTVIAIQTAYSVYVGGDAWEWWGGANRYICVVMPLGFVLLALAARQLYYGLISHAIMRGAIGLTVVQSRFAVGGALVLAFAGLNVAAMDWREPLLMSPPPEIAANRRNVEYAQLVRGMTEPTAKVAVVWAGTTPYFCDREYIDLLGKCDVFVAHTLMHAPIGRAIYTDFYPGHLKWDYGYSIGRLQPDLILSVDILHPDCASYMDAYGILPLNDPGMYIALRTGSPRINPRVNSGTANR